MGMRTSTSSVQILRPNNLKLTSLPTQISRLKRHHPARHTRKRYKKHNVSMLPPGCQEPCRKGTTSPQTSCLHRISFPNVSLLLLWFVCLHLSACVRAQSNLCARLSRLFMPQHVATPSSDLPEDVVRTMLRNQFCRVQFDSRTWVNHVARLANMLTCCTGVFRAPACKITYYKTSTASKIGRGFAR